MAVWYGLVVAMVMVAVVTKVTDGADHHRTRRQTALVCGDDNTKVKPPYEYASNTNCAALIGKLPDLYNMVHRKTCQRWLGLPGLPDKVLNSYVLTCRDNYNGSNTVRYTSHVCCEDHTTENRCFTCHNATDGYDCTHLGEVKTCAADQVCMTENRDYKRNSYSTGYSFATCSSKEYCERKLTNNSATCKHYAASPACTSCCTGPFCNYLPPARYLHVYDDICEARKPCYNGGTCHTNSSGIYWCECPDGFIGTNCRNRNLTCQNEGYLSGSKCYCPITKTGLQCERDAPPCPADANYPCLNGGICYDHTQYGRHYRCHCKEGHVGAHCEIATKLECSADDTYFNYTGNIRTYSEGYYISNCTILTNNIGKYRVTSYVSLCHHALSRKDGTPYFKNGVHGLADRLESISLYECSIGDGLLQYRMHMCCPSCYSNPCKNGGWCQQDTNWDYVCKCRYGYEGRNCENKISMCLISGDPHYQTFDGQLLHFQGTCSYDLTLPKTDNIGLPDFKISAQNERRNGRQDVSYLESFEIKYYNYLIKLMKNGVVTVNGVQVFPDYTIQRQFRITKKGLFVRFEAIRDSGLVVEFDGYWVGLLKVPESYRDKIDGLCGNFDGDADNDMMTSGKVLSTSFADVGNSWKSLEQDRECADATNDNPPPCTDIEHLLDTKEYCGLLQKNNPNSPFKDCLQNAFADFYSNCKFDVCANQANLTAAKMAACDSLAAMAEFCRSKKYYVLWRTPANCDVACDDGMVFKERTTACLATCESPDASVTCGYPDTENCVCPDHLVLLNGTCQTPDKCRCPGGQVIGDWWLGVDCKTRYECTACDHCGSLRVARVKKTAYGCAAGQVCQEVDGRGKCQTCAAAGGWGEWSAWSVCRTSGQSRDRTCDNPRPACGGRQCTGPDTETRSCVTDGSEPDPPICAKDFDFQRACEESDELQNPNNYVMNPCSCDIYYVCHDMRSASTSKRYRVEQMSCSPCTCWNNDVLTCDHDPQKRNPNHADCKFGVPSNIDQIKHIAEQCISGASRFAVNENSPYKFKEFISGDIYVDRDCAPGTVFDFKTCHCVHGGNNIAGKQQPICLTFNDKSHPLKNDREIYVSWKGRPVLESGKEGLAVRLAGEHGEVPYYNTKDMRSFSFSVWFLSDSGRTDTMTLISHDDCENAGLPSIQLYVRAATVGGGIQTTSANMLSAFNNIPCSVGMWHHAVMTYDGQSVRLYIDGQQRGTAQVQGVVKNVHCPLFLGSMYRRSYFYGLLDQVCLYEEALSDADVKNIFVEYS